MAFMFYEIYTYNCKYKIKILEHGSNLWLLICCRQLLLPHCIATTKQFTGLFCLQQITAAFHYCNAVSQVRELCRGATETKRPHIVRSFLLAPQTGLEPVTPRLTAACSANWAIEAYSVLFLFIRFSNLWPVWNIVALLAWSASQFSLFLHTRRINFSSTGRLIPLVS